MLCLYDLQHLFFLPFLYISIFLQCILYLILRRSTHDLNGCWDGHRSGCDDHPTGLALPAESACGVAAADQLWGRTPSERGRNCGVASVSGSGEVYSKIILKLDILYWTSKIIILNHIIKISLRYIQIIQERWTDPSSVTSRRVDAIWSVEVSRHGPNCGRIWKTPRSVAWTFVSCREAEAVKWLVIWLFSVVCVEWNGFCLHITVDVQWLSLNHEL